MITFKKFILESNQQGVFYNISDSKIHSHDDDYNEYILKDEVIDNIITVLKRDCQNWISELRSPQKALSYRGIMGIPNVLFMKKNTRQNRRPKDTSKNLSDIWDNWFEKNFGFRARSESAFVTGNKLEARNYGDIYLFYPIGNQYSYLSSRGIYDLTNQFPRLYIDAARNDKEYMERRAEINTVGFEKNLNMEEVFQTMNEKTNYEKDINLYEYIIAGSEIMVKTDAYYALYAEDLNLIKPILEQL